MHFSIPDTQEFVDGTGNSYIGYNVHINGTFHCVVRYKQLHNLHKQLVKGFDTSLPPFPPKRFFPLTVNQQEERRLSLEKYIQTIGQNTTINNSDLLNGFLLNAQQETFKGLFNNEHLDVFLMNDYRITIHVSTEESSVETFKKVCDHVNLHERYRSYFALYIIVQDEDRFNVLRKLQNFESPLVTYKTIGATGSKIVLGRNYWDIGYDIDLTSDPVALNLLYIQVASEISREWILAPRELHERLASLGDSGEKEQYLNIARTLKYYGYVHFAPCSCDYPRAGSKVSVAIGRNELNLRISTTNEEYQEAVFKVSRMRCWRITTLQNAVDKREDNGEFGLEISFEYLMARNQLQWISIVSEQAILMSVCLQAMIDELLSKSIGGNKSQQVAGKSWTYVTRDGQNRLTIGPRALGSSEKLEKIIPSVTAAKSASIVNKITHRLAVSNVRRSIDAKRAAEALERQRAVRSDVMENNAFNVIGDDDL